MPFDRNLLFDGKSIWKEKDSIKEKNRAKDKDRKRASRGNGFILFGPKPEIIDWPIITAQEPYHFLRLRSRPGVAE